jgi:PKD repeat protein
VTVSVGRAGAPPTVLVASPASGSSFGSTGSLDCDGACIRFAGVATGDVASVLVSVDGGVFQRVDATRAGTVVATSAGAAWSWDLTTAVYGAARGGEATLANGEHAVAFSAVSPANESSVPRVVEIDVRSPRVLSIVADATPRFTGTPLPVELANAGSANVTWLLDGDVVGYGARSTMTLATPGDHVLEAVSTDQGVARLPLFAVDRPPVVLSAGALPAPTGEETVFGAQASDADGVVASFAWDFGDGTTMTTANGSATHVYAHPGAYAASVQALDDLAVTSGPTAVPVDVPNHPPVANFTFSPQDPTLLDRVVFHDLSADPDGRIVSSSWDFGEPGAAASGPDVAHTFATRGDHVVGLVVQDDSGAIDTVSQVVHVRNVPPTALFGHLPESPVTGEDVRFVDASVKPDGEIRQWLWDFGDGSRDAGPNVTHAFAQPGLYGVTLQVTDDWGDADTYRADVLVRDAAPDVRSIEADPPAPRARDPVRFHATAFDKEGTVTTVHWDFGDGATSDALEPAHRYAHSGTYNVTATATDQAGLNGTLTTRLVVGDQPPVVSFGGITSAYAGVPATVTANASDADGRIVGYTFDMDGDGTPDCVTTQPQCTFTYPYDGAWTVWINASDDEGAMATASHVVDVLPPPSGLAPPQLRVDAPLPSAVLRGEVLVRGAAASDVANVTSVEVQARSGAWTFSSSQGEWATADGTDLWSLLLDTRAFPDGPIDLVVRATDERGGATELRVPVTIDNERDPTAPQVDVQVSLAPGQQLLNDTLVRVVATNPGGVTSVRWRVDDDAWQSAVGNGILWAVPLTVHGMQPGPHTLVVDAWHGVTDHGEASVPFVLAGQAPTLVVDLPPGPTAYGVVHAEGRATPGATVLYRVDNDVWHQASGSAAWSIDASTTSYDVGPHVVRIKALDPDLGLETSPRAFVVTVVNEHVHAAVAKAQSSGERVKAVPLDAWAAVGAVALAGGARRRRA